MKKKYIVISLLSILIMTIGMSYAYFVSDINVNRKEMNVSSKRLAIIFTDTKEIVENEIMPGWSTSKTFTVENKSGSVFYYDINIEDLINTFVTTGYLQYKITSTDGGYNMEEFVDIPKSDEARREVLANKIEIGNEEKHTYTIEFRYLNDPNVNQSEDMDCIFGGTLSITESNIMIVKYKVNDVIQDIMPDKEEPYVVKGVECSNNVKGIWNEETEKVELLEEVTQTVCIVEFGEGHTVNILTSNGEIVSPVSKVVGRIGETTFTIEEKEGYTLEDAAIVCDNGGEGSLEGNTIIIRNIKQNNTCTVITNPIEVTVTYNVNGGNALNPTSKTVIYTGTYGSLPTPTRTGYTFSGWYTSSTGGTKIIESTEVTSTTNHTIYARWTAKTITVTYNQNGGSGVSPASNTVTYNTKYKLPTTNPTRAGYTFAGWFTSASGGTQVTTNTTLTNASNHSIYAHWNPNTITLTLNNQSATTAGSTAVYYKYNTATYYSNSALSTTITKITVPSRTGYTFGGYYTAASGGGTQYINASGSFVNNPHTALKANTTLYAKWTANTITVTYDQNGGSGVSPTSNTVTYGAKYKLPTTNPTRVGYTFVGWFTSASGGTQVTTGTTLTNASNHSIYAHWTINKYNVTVNVVNGRVTTTNPLSIAYGGSGTFTIVANSGYKLDGATVSCTGGSYNQAGSLTVSNVTSARTCTVTLVTNRVTFNVVSKSDPDRETSASPTSACYYENIWSPDGTQRNTFTYVGTDKNYNNCTIVKAYCPTRNSGWMMRDNGYWGCLWWENSEGQRCENSVTKPSGCWQTGVSKISCSITIECDA